MTNLLGTLTRITLLPEQGLQFLVQSLPPPHHMNHAVPCVSVHQVLYMNTSTAVRYHGNSGSFKLPSLILH